MVLSPSLFPPHACASSPTCLTWWVWMLLLVLILLRYPMKTFLTNNDVLVTDTDEYMLIKIPKQHKTLTKKQPTWESLVGVLQDVPALKGKTSVEVQDMIQDAWATQTRNNLHS